MTRLPDLSLVTVLTVDPVAPTEVDYLLITQSDWRVCTFAAGEAVTAVVAELQSVASRATADGPVAVGGTDGAIVGVALATPTATITLDGATLTIGGVYELLVTFTRSTGERWTRTLPLECTG